MSLERQPPRRPENSTGISFSEGRSAAVPARLQQILARRRETGMRWFGRRSVLGSVIAHALLLVVALAGPLLFADRHRPLDYVEVVAVPEVPQKPRPKPKPAPPREEPSPPEPEVKPEPLREPDPEVPVLPDEEPEKKPEPEPVPQPPAPEPAQPEPDPGEAETAEPVDPFIDAGPNQAVMFDNPDFTFGYYVNQMSGAIRRVWQRPRVRDDVLAVLHFVILKDGTVQDLQLVSSSGNATFDRSAMRALQDASPLPPLPRGYREESLGVTLRFH